jgi:pantoate kinase
MRRYWIIMFIFLWLMSILVINHLSWNARASFEKVLRRPLLFSLVESSREFSKNGGRQQDQLRAWLQLLNEENGQKEGRG